MKAILLIFLVACSLVTQAKDLPLTGSHSVVFPTASPEGKNNAAHEAQRFAAIHAIEQMISTQPSAIRQLYNERKPHIVNDILAICTQVTNNQSLNEKKDEVTVTFSAVIDEDRMKDLLQRTQPVQANVQLESVDIAVFFTARNAAALQKQGQTVIQTNNLKKSKEASEAGAIADTAVQSDASVVERETKTTGASTVVTADQITYRLDPPAREEFGTHSLPVLPKRDLRKLLMAPCWTPAPCLMKLTGEETLSLLRHGEASLPVSAPMCPPSNMWLSVPLIWVLPESMKLPICG